MTNCNEFILPILSVFLLKEGTDIDFNFPPNAMDVDYNSSISLSSVSGEGYATIHANADGTIGTKLIADDDSFQISTQQSTKQSGINQKVTLEYKVSCKSDDASYPTLNPQSSILNQSHYSLLLEFFDGTRGLVRCYPNGQGWSFSSKSSEGTFTNSINIHNLTGILKIVS